MSGTLLPITEVARRLDLGEEHLHSYGPYIAKVKLDVLGEQSRHRHGKLVLVTAMTPTAYGEGKTVVTIGLAQGLTHMGKRAVATLREPSLGPVFGVKGGATGGGRARILPSEKIDLHFTGDFHAITAAHNLLCAAVDSHVFHGNELHIDPSTISLPRCVDMNDRALRKIIVGLGGKNNGIPREAGFVITAATETMAVLALATSRADLRRRLEDIVVANSLDGGLVRARDLGVTGAMLVLLNDAIMPNLVQTSEHTPALVHCGPFANIAHGTSSVLAQRMGLQLADYVVNEAGFGADLGAEKYFDIVMPASGIKPEAVVVVVTVKALAVHGSAEVERGLSNLDKHLDNLGRCGVPAIVALNLFPDDAAGDVAVVRRHCEQRDVPFAVVEAFGRGGEGAVALAEAVVSTAESGRADARSLYRLELGLVEKIERLAGAVYGAEHVHIEPPARRKLARFTDQGFGGFPICVAKTALSLSDDPKRLGAPTGWTFTVSDAHLSAGAGFVVVVAGAMNLMPGLPKLPRATVMDVDDEGMIVSLD
jgi:formate--tetrahydrofolate ligase